MFLLRFAIKCKISNKLMETHWMSVSECELKVFYMACDIGKMSLCFCLCCFRAFECDIVRTKDRLACMHHWRLSRAALHNCWFTFYHTNLLELDEELQMKNVKWLKLMKYEGWAFLKSVNWKYKHSWLLAKWS